MCKTMVKTVLVRGSGTWPVAEVDVKTVNTWETQMLRRIFLSLIQ
jgi:hypothetical protein